ncbi:MAG: hypothetical protein RLN60_03400 [Phycisphaerales bacterium]
MAAKKQALEKYRSIMEQADQIADQAAKEVRARAKELIEELAELGEEYEELTGEELPEAARLNGTASSSRKKSPSSGGGTRKKTKLRGAYADLTVPDAIIKALKGVKEGMGPADVAEKIGGNKNTVTVAMSNMAKDGTIKRVARGTYTA